MSISSVMYFWKFANEATFSKDEQSLHDLLTTYNKLLITSYH